MAQKQKPNIFVSFIDAISSLFLTGLFSILPITLTIAVFTITFRVLLSWLEPLKRFGLPFLGKIPYSEVILAIAIIFIAGTLYNMFLLRPIIHGIENLFSRIPLIRPVYSGIKKLVDAFSFQDKVSFTKVVRIEFPRPGIYSIGFLANQVDEKIAPDIHTKYFSIFIPTTPNPTSGFLIVAPEEQITVIDISRQEAMAMIISGGIIQPDTKQ
ncbi:MAG TPA: DUF502 domain-containing protein [Candidatus Babeliales bacterium]|jgi:uncharacterized membrane protein|nr:DUF502 domain-containing protein [Candidatus Babeliales bacterium]